MFRWGKTLIALALVMAIPPAAAAQTVDNPPAPNGQAQPASQLPASAELLKPEQLEALVAPVALYPDDLLVNVLAASTYPLEVVQADRWLRERKSLKDDALKKEVEKQSWDESVKALASTRDVISMMSDKIDWTKNLGDAVLAQQADVMDAIQRLRTKAYESKKLVTTEQQKVNVQTQESKQVVVIESADPNKIYVPYYDPVTVYGTWPSEEYPPYYFGYPSYIGAGVIAAGLAFGTAWAIGRWGNYWGGGLNWGNRNLYVNHYNRINNTGNNWQHNPSHRQGVRYNNTNVQQRFGNNNLKAGASNRMDFRGREGQQALRPGQERPGGDRVGDRTGDRSGDRANSRDRTGGDRGNRPSSADRAKGGGNRAKAANRGSNAARGGGGRGSALNVSSGRAAAAQSVRGRASVGARGGGARSFASGGGGMRAGGGGGGFRGGGGGGGFRGGGGGRRSDIALKHDVMLLGRLGNGLGYYRFSYSGSSKPYVGVIAQEVQSLMPQAVTRGQDGYLRVHYEKLGLKFRSYDDWLAGGAGIPTPSEVSP